MAAPPASITNVVSVAAGSRHNLVLKNDGTLAAWGDNSYAQNSIPTNLSKVVAIEEKLGQCFAVKADHTAVSWGYNGNGLYQMPAGLTNVASIAAGGWHALALKTDGNVVAWGFNDYSQTNVPAGLSNLVAVAAGGHHSLALKADGTVVGWGYDGSGTIVVPDGLSNVVAIAAGDAHCLALRADGTVEAWGFNEYGQTDVPADLADVVGIAAGEAHSLALKRDGTVVAWGDSGYGQTDVPAGLSNVAAIAAGRYHSMALQADGPPFILTPSVCLSTVPGGTVLLRAAATGSLPLSYQWRLGGNPIAGATNSVLLLTGIQPGQAGAYGVVVSNALGVAASAVAELTVSSSPPLATYDLSLDFSAAVNPGRVWAYGYAADLNGSFGVMTVSGITPTDNSVPLQYWQYAPGFEPTIFHNATISTATSVSGHVIYEPGTVVLYPGSSTQSARYCVARFTVPPGGTGNYLVVSSTRPEADATWQGDSDFHVVKTGVEVFGQHLGATDTTAHTNVLSLAEGETVDFLVGPGTGTSGIKGQKVAARLELINSDSLAPCIVGQPLDQVVPAGATASFTVVAIGTKPLTYQWLHDGVPISGGTNATLSLANVQAALSGPYSVIVSNPAGVVTSVAATLTVSLPSLAVFDLSQDFSASFNPTGAWSYGYATGLTGSFGLLSVHGVTTVDNGVAMGYWQSGVSREPTIFHNQTSSTGLSVFGHAVLPPGTVILFPGSSAQPDRYCVARFTTPVGYGGFYRLITAAAPEADATWQGDSDYHVIRSGVEIFGKFLGKTDTAAYTNRLNLAEGETLDFVAGTGVGSTGIKGLKVTARLEFESAQSSPPVVVLQPQDMAVMVGATATFSVTASGTAPLFYQWLFNGGPIAEATNSVLALADVQLGQAGDYSVVITNVFGTVTTSIAHLTVTPYTTVLASYDLFSNSSATSNPAGVWSYGYATALDRGFGRLPVSGVTAADNGVPLVYWQTRPSVEPTIFFNQSSNTALTVFGHAKVEPGTVILYPGPAGQAERYCVARFTVPAGGAGDYRFAATARPEADSTWQGDSDFHVVKSGVEVLGWHLTSTDTVGCTNVLSLVEGDTVDFIVGGGIESAGIKGLKVAARLDMVTSVPSAPRVVLQPRDIGVLLGGTATFDVMAVGTPPLSYQWQWNGIPMAGATNSTLVLSNAQTSQAGVYVVVVSNAQGIVTSQGAELKVSPQVSVLATHDISAEFSAATNPGGVWSYGYASALNGSFGRLPVSGVTAADNGVSLAYWQTRPCVEPTIFFNGTSNTALTVYGHATLPPQTVLLYPGPAGQLERFCVARFTVPAGGAGDYRIVACASPEADASWQGDSDFHVLKAGVELFGQHLGVTDSVGYTNLVVLAEGETVDFLVGGGTGSTGIKGLKVAARLEWINSQPVPPSVAVQPRDVTAIEGETASFTVVVRGTPPLHYQWEHNGNPLIGEDQPTLTLTNVESALAGVYRAVVSNDMGCVTSSPATLTVVPFTPGLVVYDLNRDFSLASNPAGVWSMGSTPSLSGTFALLPTSRLAPTDNGVLLEVWQILNPGVPAVLHNGTSNTAITVYGQAAVPPGTLVAQAGNLGQVEQFTVMRFTVPADGSGLYRIETSAKPLANGSWQGNSDFHVLKSGLTVFGQALAPTEETGYTNSLSLAQGETIDFVVGRGECAADKMPSLKIQARLARLSTNAVAPLILVQPVGQSVADGDRVTFHVEAVGTAPLAFQWYFNGAPLDSAAAATLTLDGVQASQAGDYYVVVTNDVGSVTSAVVSLTINQLPPVITAQPTSVVVTQGASVSLSVAATGSRPLLYQWLFNGWPIPDATNAILSLGNVQEPQVGSYAVRVSNAIGALQSDAATLTFAPSFEAATVSFSSLGGIATNRPYVFDLDGVTRLAGANYLVQLYAGLSADALSPIGMAVPFLDGSSAGLFNGGIRHLAGVRPGTAVLAQVRAWEWAAGPTFEAALASGGKTGASTVFVQPTGGGLNIPARLAMPSFSLGSMPGSLPPQIGAHPLSQTVLVGASVTFQVQADGSQPLHYQWLKGQALLQDATNLTLVVSNAQLADAADYSVVVTNLFGAVTSQVATLTLAVQQVLSVVSPPEAPQASQISVPLELSGEGNVAGMTFVLRFNPDYLSEPEVVWGAPLDGAFREASTGVPGELRMVFVRPGDPIAAGTQTVATVRFYARATPEDVTANLDLELVDVSAADGDPVLRGTAVRNGSVRILGGTLALGDNNANGRLDVGDATLLLRTLARVDTIRSWDVSGNDLNLSGTLDSGDAIKILRVAAGLDTPASSAGGSALLRRAAKSVPSPSLAAVLTPSRARAAVGGFVTFQVVVQDLAIPVSGASFTLRYPSAALRLAGPDAHRLGGMAPAGAASVWNLSPDGDGSASQVRQISLAVSSGSSWATNRGVLAEFSFQVMPPADNQLIWPLLLTQFEIGSGYRTTSAPDSQALFGARDPRPGSVSDPHRALSGAFDFSFTGESGGDYIVEYSGNLRDWITLTNLLNGSGSMSISDPGAASAANRFYRVRPAH